MSRALLLIGAGVALLACSESTSPRGSGDASLSFTVASSNRASLASIIVPGTGPVVDLQSADVVFDKITFSGTRPDAVGCEVDDEHEDDDFDNDANDDCDEAHEVNFRAGASTVTLPLQGGVITPFTGQLPEGTYRRLSMRAEFVRLRGTVDGQPFDVTVPVNSKLKVRIEPPLVIGTTPTPANVSVNIDALSWLRDRNGVVVDPRLLATDSQLQRDFRKRVRASFKAFDDHDRNGRGDD